MQYVGRFVSSVYNTITPNINPATLSGAIDVIVVERQVEKEVDDDDDAENDGQGFRDAGVGGYSIDDVSIASSSKSPTPSISSRSSQGTAQEIARRKKKRKTIVTTELASTPFHVRFGKMSVLRPAERKVTLHLNSSPDPLPFAMKVGEAGEAFFVVELDGKDGEGGIPDELVTSPILSATTSPEMQVAKEANSSATTGEVYAGVSADHVGPHKLIAEDYVEPLDLGTARSDGSLSLQASSHVDSSDTATVRSGETRLSGDTAATSPSLGGSESVRGKSADSREGIQDSERSDGANDDGGSLLGSVGNAASKASGVIGAAGAALMPSIGGGRNVKLEKLNKGNVLRNKAAGVRETGAGVESSQPAHRLDTNEHSETKKRMQRQDDEHPPEDIKNAQNETERLEIHMRDRTRRLVEETIEARREKKESMQAPGDAPDESLDSTTSRGEVEEQYPAPFGGSGISEEVSGYATTQPDHELFLAGHKVEPVKSGLPGRSDIGPAKVDPRTIEGRLREWREEHPQASTKPTSLQGGPQVSKHSPGKYHLDGSNISAISPNHKEDLQYMLDMDGYKMTADGEDLAFAEGSRLSSEMPMSKSHDGQLSHEGMFSKDGKGHTALVDDVSSELSKIQISNLRKGDAPSTTLSATLDELDASLSKTVDAHAAAGTAEKSVSADEVSLSRDLVRLTRHLHQEQECQAEGSAMTRPTRPERAFSRRSQFHDMSLSDTEADGDDYDDNASEAGGSLGGSTKRRGQTGITRGTSHQRSTSMATPSHSIADNLDGPVVRDDAALGLASSSDLEWTWGNKRRGPRRPRVLSSADLPDEPNTEDTGKTDLGRLTYNHRDPYEFQLQLGDTSHTFSLSLCNVEALQDESATEKEEADSSDKQQGIAERFDDYKISYQRFLADENAVNDARLVVHYNDRYLTWENASTVLATLSLYRKTLGDTAADASLPLAQDGPQVQEASVWRRWWYRNKAEGDHAAATETGTVGAAPLERANTDSVIDIQAAQQARAETAASVPKKVEASPKVYAKTLRLTSDQLKSLNLRKGANTITFSVTSSYSGVATCTARIFLWDSTHQVVVSDIDGTITKSDALGHVFTMIGRDWTHSGVAKLYTDIARNGYRIMYLTSRAIGQADTTRDYLRGITQNNFKLPDGPVIMSPDRLMASLHREVILRKPEVFKMACLRDIARLFGADPRASQSEIKSDWPSLPEATLDAANGPGAGKEKSPAEGAATRSNNHFKPTGASPFYAGFGNRITDALSYRSVNIPSSRIFTIDSNGEVKMELLELAGYKSSYIHMTDLVDQMFPPISLEVRKRDAGKPEFNNFNFWRAEIGEFELPDDDELMSAPIGSSPTSPALSARSVRTVRSNGSIRSQSGSIASTNDKTNAREKSTTLPEQETPSSAASTSRLSRFGLGKLGLSRRGSGQTIAALPSSTSLSEKEGGDTSRPTGADAQAPKRAETTSIYSEGPTAQAARRMSPPASPSSSYGSGVTSWTANWRRRGTSPTPGADGANPSSPRATSPLVGPVISADPDEMDEEDDDGQEDDDVSSFDGDEDDGEDDEFDENTEGNGNAGNQEGHGSDKRSSRRRRQRRLPSSVGSAGADDALEDDDPLLATGEIRFEWRG